MSESQRHPTGDPVDESAEDLVGSAGGGPRGSAGAAASTEPEELQPLALSSATITLWGTIGWLLALGLILAVPSLHEGDRHWWPWTCVAAIVLGLLGFSYVRRGRGNATGAE